MLESICSPQAIITIFFVVGLALKFFRSRFSRIGTRFLVVASVLFLVVTYSPLANMLLRTLEAPFPPITNISKNLPKNIVVLAGYGEEHPGIPVTSCITDETLCRLLEGARVYRAIPDAKLIISGGIPREGDKSVSAIMADCINIMGIPDQNSNQSIILEDKSHNTYENFMYVRELLGIEPFILVTSGLHMRRALAVSRKLGMNAVPASACIRTLQRYPPGMSLREWLVNLFEDCQNGSFRRWTYLQWTYHEYAGYLWYKLKGWI